MRARPSRTVVVDSNAIVQGPWRLESASWKVLLYQARVGAARVVVPELVVRETVGKFRIELEKRKDEANRGIKKLGRMAGDEGLAAIDLDVDEAFASYEQRVRATLERSGVVVTPIPTLNVDQLVDRAIARRRPFDDSGSGFRDSLVWETLVAEACSEGVDEVVLVSNDSKAFRAPGDSPALHPDLADELKARGSESRVTLMGNLASLLDTGGHADADLSARIIEDLAAHQQTLRAQVVDRLIEAELASDVFPRSAAIVTDVLEAELRVLQVTTPGPEESLVLVHMDVELLLTVDLILDDYATPNVTSLRGSANLAATATYDAEARQFGDLQIDLPPLHAISSVVAELVSRGEVSATSSIALPYPTEMAEQLRGLGSLGLRGEEMAEQLRRLGSLGLRGEEMAEQMRGLGLLGLSGGPDRQEKSEPSGGSVGDEDPSDPDGGGGNEDDGDSGNDEPFGATS